MAKSRLGIRHKVVIASFVCIGVLTLVGLLSLWGRSPRAGPILSRLLDKLDRLIFYRTADVRRVETLAMIGSLATHIQVFVGVDRKKPPAEIALFADFFEEASPGTVEHFFGGQYRVDPNTGTGSFLDYWDHPIRLVVESPNHYRLISAGPNGKDENGEGDDIVHDFDPLEFYNSEESQLTKQR